MAGPAATYAATATASGGGTLTATVVDSNLQWWFPYEFIDLTGSGTLTYQVASTGCSGWNVSVVASPFRYSGPAPGATLPTSSLSLISAGAPTTVTGSGTGVSSMPSTGSLATARAVMRAESGRGNGTYQQVLNVGITVPAGTSVGSYRSTITINAASGP
jgi:hypothetical protein